jgi:hypothetical protein
MSEDTTNNSNNNSNVIPINPSITVPTASISNGNSNNRKKLREASFPNRAISKINENTPGTLAYAFAQQSMDHATVYAFLLHIQDEDPRVVSLIADYDLQTTEDKFSINIWDKLCKKHKIPVDKLYGKLAAAAFKMARSMSFMTLAKHENQIMERLAVHAKREENIEHTKLYTEVAGLTGRQSNGNGVNIQFNQQNNDHSSKQIVFGLPPLEETLKNPVKQVREAQALMLEDGNGKTEFITAEEIVNDKGEIEYVEAEQKRDT